MKKKGEVLWVREGLTERCQKIPSKDDSDSSNPHLQRPFQLLITAPVCPASPLTNAQGYLFIQRLEATDCGC